MEEQRLNLSTFVRMREMVLLAHIPLIIWVGWAASTKLCLRFLLFALVFCLQLTNAHTGGVIAHTHTCGDQNIYLRTTVAVFYCSHAVLSDFLQMFHNFQNSITWCVCVCYTIAFLCVCAWAPSTLVTAAVEDYLHWISQKHFLLVCFACIS